MLECILVVDLLMKLIMDLLLDMLYQNISKLLWVNVLKPALIIIQISVKQTNLVHIQLLVGDSISGTWK